MRNRLIELLNNIGMIHEREAETVAEYLLDKGVIVPPCKVGDIVYQVTRNFISEFRVRCIEIGVKSCKHSLMFLHTELLSGIITTGEVLWASDFGKTVFLTREEAEKALKRGVQG